MKKSILFLTILLAAVTSAHGEPTNAKSPIIKIEEGCDIPGNNLKSSKEKSPPLCAEACDKEPKCKGFTFISGWNKCFLKSKVKTQAKVTMIAAHNKDGFKLHFNHDNSGKDFKNIVLDSEKLCLDECRKNSKCKGFSYIKGYRSCWLKKTLGRVFPKVFYCGIKKS